ncbi:efflux RND transporter periplasmic adaptor subunit [Leptospira borgpetersenii]|uniref:efflux RND transporter periplasmic adaptor subunit n=1 Tax=Leptospira borgpetersenii TaxID=174 RepID=UPI0007742BAE|nr:efflux RND transporter periplasmic adaptor subunit [Leptospira borgpetersenii]MBE8400455.1 efflux RND transporter periplasmic adaptor subunit [Leptospira borgpetersenii serovar Tarassovi]MBE8402546.1 efflux RND transporter periplasmic adaptor subunit [Leptospira borgpetersenii serovar Tarassovi]MBE8407473.1 efflux RND transporter periplasmic adaptor subunit [Leptospira borgpetersenii serovar Tarassovi]MBE8412920.1 efflux RND transporter periplasmic adaptor subunit [Leptospira borgpetersenii 
MFDPMKFRSYSYCRVFRKCIWIVILLFLFTDCKKSEKKEEVLPLEDRIKLAKIDPGESSSGLKVLGSVSFFKKAEVTSKILGRIQQYFKEEGDSVLAGDVLAKMETLNLEIQLSKDQSSVEVQTRQRDLASAKLLIAKQRVDRELADIEKAEADVRDSREIRNNLLRSAENKKKLNEAGAVSETELKSVETSLNSAEISLFKAEKNLASLKMGYRPEDLNKANIQIPKTKSELKEAYIKLNTMIENAELDMAEANFKSTLKNMESTQLLLKESNIKSPLSGTVASRIKEQGEAVKEGEALYIVVDTSKVILKFNIGESELWKLKKDQKVNFIVDAYPGQNFEGKVYIISPIVDPQSRTVEVKVIAQNEKKLLKPGMFTRGYILLEEARKKTFLIPLKALIKNKEGKSGTVFVANEENRLFSVEVEIIKEESGFVEVLGNLELGRYIAISDLNELKEGQKVKIPKEQTPSLIEEKSY